MNLIRENWLIITLIFILAGRASELDARVSTKRIASQTPRIAVAADLKPVVEKLVSRYEQESGVKLKVNYDTSAHLIRQIVLGTKYDVYVSADEDSVFALAEEGYAQDQGKVLALNRIVLYVAKNASIRPDSEFKSLRNGVKSGKLKKIAIPMPEYVPAGKAAQEALTTAGLWQSIQKHISYTESVDQALSWALANKVDMAIAPLSVALAPPWVEKGNLVIIRPEWYRLMRQRVVLMKKANEASLGFYHYIQKPESLSLFSQHGFLLPTEGDAWELVPHTPINPGEVERPLQDNKVNSLPE